MLIEEICQDRRMTPSKSSQKDFSKVLWTFRIRLFAFWMMLHLRAEKNIKKFKKTKPNIIKSSKKTHFKPVIVIHAWCHCNYHYSLVTKDKQIS